jgi:chemotaxis protein CheD
VGEGGTQVGPKNIAFVKRYLSAEGLTVLAADLGGTAGRRIHYHPATGRVRRLLLKPTTAAGIVADERRYRTTLSAAPVEGDIELFD